MNRVPLQYSIYCIARNVGVAKIWQIALKNSLAIKNLAS